MNVPSRSLLGRVAKATTLMGRRFGTRYLGKGLKEVPGLVEVDHTHTIEMRDGESIVVREYEETQPGQATVVFAHGFTLSSQSWFFQAQAVKKRRGARMLIPDLRGHGESQDVTESLEVDTAGRDLVDVIRTLAPESELILVGHSMGVMAVLAMLRHLDADELSRVRGVALINGAVDTFASAGITQILGSLPIRGMRHAGKNFPTLAEHTKNGTDLLLKPIIASSVYHGALEEGMSADFDIVDFHAEEIDRTPMRTILGYLDDLVVHDETKAAPLLDGIPGVVMVGSRDDITPADQTRKIAAAWPGGVRLVEFPDSGHMLPVEAPEAVNKEIIRLLDGAAGV